VTTAVAGGRPLSTFVTDVSRQAFFAIATGPDLGLHTVERRQPDMNHLRIPHRIANRDRLQRDSPSDGDERWRNESDRRFARSGSRRHPHRKLYGLRRRRHRWDEQRQDRYGRVQRALASHQRSPLLSRYRDLCQTEAVRLYNASRFHHRHQHRHRGRPARDPDSRRLNIVLSRATHLPVLWNANLQRFF
jgi:hypothetical protein